MTERQPIADEILRAIRRIVRRISQHSNQLSRAVGLTVPQLLCIKTIGELGDGGDDDITVAKVSDAVQLSAATVSRIVDRLVRADLLVREQNPRDRRRVSLSLTALGRERFASLPDALQERFVERLSRLPEAEAQQLVDSLDRIAMLMEAEEIDAAPILTDGADLPTQS